MLHTIFPEAETGREGEREKKGGRERRKDGWRGQDKGEKRR